MNPTIDFNTIKPLIQKDIRKPKKLKGKRSNFNGSSKSIRIEIEGGDKNG